MIISIVTKPDLEQLDELPPDPSSSLCGLWFAPGDPMYSMALDRDGGVPLFGLAELDAIGLLLRWYRFHHERYLAEQLAIELRKGIRSVEKDVQA